VLTLHLGDPLPDGAGMRRAIAAIGNFDGVHLGHRYLLEQVVEVARQRSLASLAVTFWPNPRAVLRPAQWPGYLTTFAERTSLLAETGLDMQVTLPFTDAFASLSPGEFVDQLAGALPLAELWVGEDFRFGHRRSGDVALLRQLTAAHGIALRAITRRAAGDGNISSSTVRDQLRAGQVEQAARLLGRPYALGGVVVSGDRRGRQLGYPTANVAPDEGKIVPGRGIYAAIARAAGIARPAALSIGIRPQFAGAIELVEAYLLDFSGDLYGQRLALELLTKIRDEQRFASVEALVAQIGRDVEVVRGIVAVPPAGSAPT
jgi:riboflavin kinase / FMN adenylyltransferase